MAHIITSTSTDHTVYTAYTIYTVSVVYIVHVAYTISVVYVATTGYTVYSDKDTESKSDREVEHMSVFKAVIGCFNAKGGVGKSTTAVNLSSALARMGYKTLLIDLDAQCDSTDVFFTESPDRNLVDVLLDDCPIQEVIYNVADNLFVIPAGLELTIAETKLASRPGRDTALSIALSEIEPNTYDLCVLDFPPNAGVLSINGLAITTDLIIPIQAHYYALKGINVMIEVINVARKRLNPNLSILGALCTQYDKRNKLCQIALEQVREAFKEKTFNTVIRNNIRLAEAPARVMDIFTHDPKSMGAEDYANLGKEVVERLVAKGKLPQLQTIEE